MGRYQEDARSSSEQGVGLGSQIFLLGSLSGSSGNAAVNLTPLRHLTNTADYK